MTAISQRNIDKHVVRTRSLTKTQYRTEKREVRIKPPKSKIKIKQNPDETNKKKRQKMTSKFTIRLAGL